jgi:glyoxylase-like metal-dependent hydrolase (beta-lactamase superfamily II)
MADQPDILLQPVTPSTVAAVDPRLASNAAAVVFPDFLVAVDVGMRPTASRLFREALERSYRRPVKFVCVTHYHADHTFGLGPFKDCTVVASREILDALRRSPDWTPEGQLRFRVNDPEGGRWLAEVEQVLPSMLFEGTLTLADAGRRLELHSGGGHTRCSVWGYLPEERVLFAGDLIFAEQVPYAGDDTADPEVWIDTLRSWLTLEVDWVIPGHGPLREAAEIARQLRFLEELRANTLATLQEGGRPEDIVVPPVYDVVREPWFVEKTRARWHAYYRSRSPQLWTRGG